MVKSYFYDEGIADWRELVKGEQGEQGPVGPVGPRGPQGIQGPMGTLELIGGDNPAITVDTSVGTRVFVGDTMLYGDTGWRDISGLLNDGWDGNIHLRRVGNQVDLEVINMSQQDGNYQPMTLPQGFRSPRTLRRSLHRFSDNQNVRVDISSGGTIDLSGYGSDDIRGHLTLLTSNAWPSTLPGTPV